MHQTTFVEARAQEKKAPLLIFPQNNIDQTEKKTDKQVFHSINKPDFNNDIVWRLEIDQLW